MMTINSDTILHANRGEQRIFCPPPFPHTYFCYLEQIYVNVFQAVHSLKVLRQRFCKRFLSVMWVLHVAPIPKILAQSKIYGTPHAVPSILFPSQSKVEDGSNLCSRGNPQGYERDVQGVLQIYFHYNEIGEHNFDQFESIFRRVRKIAKSDYQARHIRLSVRPHRTIRLPLDGFSWNFIFQYIFKICQESSSFTKIWQENEYYT
jgi:hypothetical protein